MILIKNSKSGDVYAMDHDDVSDPLNYTQYMTSDVIDTAKLAKIVLHPQGADADYFETCAMYEPTGWDTDEINVELSIIRPRGLRRTR